MDGQVKVVGSLAMWEINIRDIEVEKRIGFGSFAEVCVPSFFGGTEGRAHLTFIF